MASKKMGRPRTQPPVTPLDGAVARAVQASLGARGITQRDLRDRVQGLGYPASIWRISRWLRGAVHLTRTTVIAADVRPGDPLLLIAKAIDPDNATDLARSWVRQAQENLP